MLRVDRVLDAAEENFQAFVALAREGRTAVADDVEHAAWRLAQAVIDDASRLPREAIKGFSVFTAIAFEDPLVAANVIDPVEDEA